VLQSQKASSYEAALEAIKSNEEAFKNDLVFVKALPQGHVKLHVLKGHPSAKTGRVVIGQPILPLNEE